MDRTLERSVDEFECRVTSTEPLPDRHASELDRIPLDEPGWRGGPTELASRLDSSRAARFRQSRCAGPALTWNAL